MANTSTSDFCAVCGCSKAAHLDHLFEPKLMPDGCVCAPGTWGNTVEPICDQYKGDGNRYCENCQHDKACHG